jgi:hypothetical protein
MRAVEKDRRQGCAEKNNIESERFVLICSLSDIRKR